MPQGIEMKALKSTKRSTVGARKAASRINHATGRGRNVSRPSSRLRHNRAAKQGVNGRDKAGPGNTVPSLSKPQVDTEYQAAVKNFETGVRAFQKQNYARAAEIFEKLVDSDARDIAQRAHIHLRLCRQRTGRPAHLPKSADDYYTLGIACLNARQFGLAIEHLTKADRLKPHQDHVHYALAVSHTLAGNPDEAIRHLEAAFSLRPENRIHARRDEDFQGLATDPRFRRLIYLAANQ